MNKIKRKQISEILKKLEDIYQDVYNLASDERECYEILPEGIQASERGEKINEAAENLEQAVEHFEELTESLRQAME